MEWKGTDSVQVEVRGRDVLRQFMIQVGGRKRRELMRGFQASTTSQPACKPEATPRQPRQGNRV